MTHFTGNTTITDQGSGRKRHRHTHKIKQATCSLTHGPSLKEMIAKLEGKKSRSPPPPTHTHMQWEQQQQ